MVVVRNVHERVVAAPAGRVWELVEGLWPSREWTPMRLDRQLAVGARGGHAMIRYAVTAYDPGRCVEFTFAPATGVHGTHSFTVAPVGPDRTLLRHELVGRLAGRTRLTWPLVVRWLHDALIEDLLDRAQDAVDAPPARRARHSAWVRLMRRVSGRSPVLRNRRGAGV